MVPIEYIKMIGTEWKISAVVEIWSFLFSMNQSKLCSCIVLNSKKPEFDEHLHYSAYWIKQIVIHIHTYSIRRHIICTFFIVPSHSFIYLFRSFYLSQGTNMIEMLYIILINEWLRLLCDGLILFLDLNKKNLTVLMSTISHTNFAFVILVKFKSYKIGTFS